MPEREERGEEQTNYHLSPIEMLEISNSWIDGLAIELKRELKAVENWPGSVQLHGGVMGRKEREIYHLKARLSDLGHQKKSNNAILHELRTPKTPNPE